MAEIIIPPPDADGYFHFLYVTRDIDGCWYGGKRSTNKHPLSDRYKGSGDWIKAHPARVRLTREIVAFYASSAEVYAAEREMITWAVVMGDPLCMNRRDGGEGMSSERIQRLHADPVYRAAYLAGVRRNANDPKFLAARKAGAARMAANPEWQKQHAAFMQRLHADPKYRAACNAGSARMAANPTWQMQHAAFIVERSSNPQWIENHAAVLRRLHTDPEWMATHLAAMKLVHARPGFTENRIAAVRRATASPEWRANNAAARERMYAARRAKKALLTSQAP